MIATNFNVREFPTVQSVMQSLDERFPADRRQFARRKGLELLRLLLFVLGSCLQIAGKTSDLLGSWMLEASRRPIAPVEPVAISVAVDTSTPDSSVEPVDLVAAVNSVDSISPLEVSDTEVEVEPLDLVFAAEEVTETEVLVEKADVNQQESEIEAEVDKVTDEIQQSEMAEEAEEYVEISQLVDQMLPAHVIPSSRNKNSSRNSSR